MFYAEAMCGRYAFHSLDVSSLEKAIGQTDLLTETIQPRYNVSPGTGIPVARRSDNEAPITLDELHWGFRPHWADGSGPQPINARAESVATSRYFRGAFANHRCLVPADGWFEWCTAPDGGKQPYYLSRRDRKVMYLAAIWTSRGEGVAPSVAIITEPARGDARDIHDRMPLALADGSLESWMDADINSREAIRKITRHIDAGVIEYWPVSRAVNRPGDGGNEALINPQ